MSVASSHEAAKLLINSGASVARLGIDDIQAIDGLRVEQQTDEHGIIDGLPFDTAANYDRVQEFADRLANIATTILDRWRR